MNKELHNNDLNDVADWLGVESHEQVETRIVKLPISNFLTQIKEMESSYDEFPEDRDRTEKIFNLLDSGECIQPVYVNDGDDLLFVMEGRHRIVAFYWKELEYIDVCFCKIKTR